MESLRGNPTPKPRRPERLEEAVERPAAEIKARAERRAGEMLREMEKNKGGNPNLFPQGNRLPKLPDLGITPKQSSAWQRVAAIPESRFEEIVAGAAAAGSRLTTKALVAWQ